MLANVLLHFHCGESSDNLKPKTSGLCSQSCNSSCSEVNLFVVPRELSRPREFEQKIYLYSYIFILEAVVQLPDNSATKLE